MAAENSLIHENILAHVHVITQTSLTFLLTCSVKDECASPGIVGSQLTARAERMRFSVGQRPLGFGHEESQRERSEGTTGCRGAWP